jgi:hypothetical protein
LDIFSPYHATKVASDISNGYQSGEGEDIYSILIFPCIVFIATLAIEIGIEKPLFDYEMQVIRALLENDYLNSLGHYLYSSIYAVTQTHEKISTLRQLDERIEAMKEETTTNGVF